MRILYVFCAFCLFGGTFALVSFPEHCADFPSKADFNLTAFLRRWYLHQIYSLNPNEYFAGEILCGYVIFRSMNDGNIEQEYFITNRIEPVTLEGTVTSTFNNDDEPGQFVTEDKKLEQKFYERILETDYENYAIIFSCGNEDLKNSLWQGQIVRIYTDAPYPSESVMTNIDKALKNFNLTGWDFSMIEHKDCTKYYTPFWNRKRI